MMLQMCLFMMLSFCGCAYGHIERVEVPVYDYNWEDMDSDYDALCDATEYEQPSQFTIWLRSFGGAIYAGICSARDYVAAKFLALQKALNLRKIRIKNKHYSRS